MAKKKIGYNVYHAPEGASESYLGFVTSLRAAKRLAAHGYELPAALYDTAIAAGHVYGVSAPDKTHEEDEPTAWFGCDGYYCVVAVVDSMATPTCTECARGIHDACTGIIMRSRQWDNVLCKCSCAS